MSIERRLAHARNCKIRLIYPWRTTLTSISLRESTEAGHIDPQIDTTGQESKDALTAQDFSDKIAYAFQLATAQGPLCHEPVQGIAVFLEEFTVAGSSDEEATSREQLGRLTGEIIKTVRDSIRQGFLDWSPRLLLAMYSCEIQASSTSYPLK